MNVDLGSQKKPKTVLLREIEKLFLGPARELIFSIKYSTLVVLTRNNHPALEKVIRIEK